MITLEGGSRSKQYLRLVLILIPILVLVAFLVLKSVNVPNWDEWELVPIFQHISSGHIYWMDFWRQHNEHRLLIPNIILVSVAEITRWNLQLEDFMNVGVAILSFLLILSVLKRTKTIQKQKPLPILLIFLVSTIWFSFVQADNWLWGWQIEWFLNVLGVAIVAYTLTKIGKTAFSLGQLLMLLAGGILAQYSLGNGTLVWPILVAILVYLRVPLKRISAVVLTGIITTVLYYTDYTNQDAGSVSLVLKHPKTFLKYFIIYLGRPLGYWHKGAPILGFILLAGFVSINVYLFVRKKAMFHTALPWLFVGLYAIGSAVITGLARLSIGTSEAYVSRYTTISMLLLVSTIAIFYHSRRVVSDILGKSYKYLSLIVVCLVFILVLVNDAWGFHASIEHSHSLRAELVCTKQENPSNACLLTAYPVPSIVAPRLSYLKQIHWGGY